MPTRVRELPLADVDACVFRRIAQAADQHSVGNRIVAVAAAMIAGGEGIVFITRTETERQIARDLIKTIIESRRNRRSFDDRDISICSFRFFDL